MKRVATAQIPGRQVRPSLLHEDSSTDWDLAAEQATLGGMLLIDEVTDAILGLLEPEDFFLPCHAAIFEAIGSLRGQGTPADLITVASQVAGDEDVISRGGAAYISSLPQLSVPALNAPHHARIVKALATRRRAEDIGWALLENRMTAAQAQASLAELCATETAESLPTIVALDFCQEVPEEPEWIMEGYLARGAITELDARIKTGKTHFATDLIRAILGGEEFLGRKTLLIPVLYLTEERQTTFRAALKRVGLDETDGLYLTFKHQTRLSWKDMGRAVAATAKRHGIGLVVVDTLSDWSGLEADMENDAGAALSAMRPLMDMAAAGLAVLVLRHERKSGGEVGESARGSSAFGGAADILLALKKDPAGGQENRRVLEAVGRLEGWAPRLVLEMTEGRYRSLGTNAQVEAESARRLLLSVLSIREDDAITEKQILEEAGEQVARSTLKRVMDELLARGALHRAKGAGSASTKAYGFWLDKEARL